MAKSKDVQATQKANTGKGSLNESKTNEDFNKQKPSKDDPELKIKKVKK